MGEPKPPDRKRKRTEEEIKIIDPAFNRSVLSPGTFELMVQGQQEKQQNLIVNIERLKEKYRKLDCPGVVELIEFLDSSKGRETQEIATNTIDFSDRTPEEFFDKIIKEGRYPMGISIGNVKRGIRPMQWLAYLAESLIYGSDKIPLEQIKAFDDICEELVRASNASITGKPIDDL